MLLEPPSRGGRKGALPFSASGPGWLTGWGGTQMGQWLGLDGDWQTDSTLLSVLLLVGLGVLSATVMASSRTLAAVFKLYDVPDARKIHSRPKPKIGGVIIVVFSIGALFIFSPDPRLHQAFVFGGAIVALTGLLDDLYQLRPLAKLSGQIAAAGVGLYLLDLVFASSQDGLLTLLPPMPAAAEAIVPYLADAFILFFWVLIINAANLADGLDGLLAGLVLATLGGVWLVACIFAIPDVQILSAVLIGCVIGFLVHNHHPATTFMGDSGSNFLGFALGLIVIYCAQHVYYNGREPADALYLVALIGYPLLDVIFVVSRRLMSGSRIFQADRRHFHYALLEVGLSHERSVQVVVGLHALFIVGTLAAFDGIGSNPLFAR